MGCLRIVFAFIVSLFITVLLLIIGIVFGTAISFFLAHGSSPQYPAPSLDFVQANSTGACIGGGFGAVLSLIITVSMLRRAADINWLKRYGQRIVATVTEIERKTGTHQIPYTVNNITRYKTETYTYYVIMAGWVDPSTKQLHTFRSPNLHTYPRRFYQGCGIEVLIDPNNIRKYYMEI